jgi:hypothetical protein
MTGVLAGNFTKSRSNWYELVGTAINFTKTANTTANNCVSEHDQFSGSNTIVIHSDVSGPPRFEAPLFGSMTFNNQSAAATTNYIVPTLAKAQPATPSVSFAVGGGSLSGNSSSTRHRVDHHGVTTLEASYIVTAPVVGRSVFRFAPPSGFEIEQASVAAAATGAAPIVGALSAAATGTDYEIWFPTTADHVIYTRVTLRATFP